MSGGSVAESLNQASSYSTKSNRPDTQSEQAGKVILLFDPPLMKRSGHNAGWVVAENGCHIWQGGRDAYGYGKTYIGRKQYAVHRIRYELEVGPIPEGLVMDHFACDNGPGGCCNPAHVRPVTRRENNLRSDSLAARYAARTHCDKGHLLGGNNALPHRLNGEGSRLCKTCYNEKRKGWRRARLARGLPR